MKASGWSDVLWGPITVSIATVVLAVASVVGGESRPWAWVIGSAAFIIVHTIVSSIREQSIVRRLGRDYDRVQSRAVQVVADLGQLAADQFALWMVDLYLPTRRWRFSRKRPFVIGELELSRQLSVSLVDARSQPPSVDPSVGPHGECFTKATPVLWFDDSLREGDAENVWAAYEPDVNERLAAVYGALSVSPLVDQLGKKCVGVLVVHVAPEPDRAIRALGALTSPEGRRRLNNACVELNGLLGR